MGTQAPSPYVEVEDGMSFLLPSPPGSGPPLCDCEIKSPLLQENQEGFPASPRGTSPPTPPHLVNLCCLFTQIRESFHLQVDLSLVNRELYKVSRRTNPWGMMLWEAGEAASLSSGEIRLKLLLAQSSAVGFALL